MLAFLSERTISNGKFARQEAMSAPTNFAARWQSTHTAYQQSQTVQPAPSLCSGFDQQPGFQLNRRIACIIFTETNHFSSAISRPIPGRNIKECLTDIKLQTASVPLSID